MHLAIGVTAIVTLLLGAFVYPRNLAGLMTMCLLVQTLPVYVALPLAIRIQMGLQSMPPPSPRSVELRKWRVTDFISPLWIGLGVVVQVLSLACAVGVYIYRPGTLGIFISLIGSGLMLLAMGAALLGYGYALAPRADPYMSHADTFRVRQRTYRAIFVGGAGLGAWQIFTLVYNTGLVHFDFPYWALAVSVLFQLQGLALVFKQNRDLDTRNFNVYRAGGSAQAVR